jgi:hypothetical protein
LKAVAYSALQTKRSSHIEHFIHCQREASRIRLGRLQVREKKICKRRVCCEVRFWPTLKIVLTEELEGHEVQSGNACSAELRKTGAELRDGAT